MRLKSPSPTDAIIVSFHARWRNIFAVAPPSVVFRIRTPKSEVNKMLLYAKAPVGAIVGYADIEKVEQLATPEAATLIAQSGLSIDEFEKYVSAKDRVGVFHLGKTTLFSNPIQLDRLQHEYDFFPPQSFSYVDLTVFQEIEDSSR